MKYKFNYTIILSLALLISACTDLEYQAVDSTIAKEGETAVIGSASDLITTLYGRVGSIFQDQAGTYALTEHPSDEMIGPTRGTDWSDNGIWRSLHTHTWNSQHQYIQDSWNALNQSVFQANTALAATDITEPQKGEARFLRALFMFHVVDFWGIAPFREVNEGVKVSPKVFSRVEATNFIISDLNFAISALPDCSDLGKANKNTAKALLAKVLINKGVYSSSNPAGPYTFENADLDKVIALADEISGSCGLGLSSTYFDNFIPSNATSSKELIFTIPNRAGAGINGSVRNRYYMTLHYHQQPSGWNGFTTLASFYDRFEPNDQRLGSEINGVTDVSGLRAGFLIGQQKDKDGNNLLDRSGSPLSFTKNVLLAGNGENEGIRVIKYPPDYSNVDNPENDYIILRLADIHLLKAEALLRKGDGGGALIVVNELRNKRGASELNSIDLKGLLDERGRELDWEGWRRNDLIRFGEYTKAWEMKNASIDGHEVLFPIPQLALDSNPNLKQNDGY